MTIQGNAALVFGPDDHRGVPRGRAQGDERLYAVACGISRLERQRAVAIRHDQLAARYEATAQIAAVNDWF